MAKECVQALQKPMPFTPADVAATIPLTSSTPKEFATSITRSPFACDAFHWVLRKFQGGYDRSINTDWLRRLREEGMTREQNLEQYILRKSTLFNNLLANAHSLHPDDLANSIIDGLPPEFSPGRISLYAPWSGVSTDVILRLSAHINMDWVQRSTSTTGTQGSSTHSPWQDR